MDIQRTIPIILDNNGLVNETVLEFNRYQRTISPVCFNDGKPLRALALHHTVYYPTATTLTSQLRCNAIRATAAAYASAKANHKPATRPFVFRHPTALFLAGRDFSFRRDGSLSISTVQGRQKIGWRIPAHFKGDFETAKRINSLRIARGRAFLCITIEAPEAKSITPVGIDLGIHNALVASIATATLFVSGRRLTVRHTKTRKVRTRLQTKLAGKKAQHQDTRSVRRGLKRLSRKHRNCTRTFCQETAAQLCQWAPADAVLVFEDLNIKPKTKKAPLRKGTRRKLNSWFFRRMTTAVSHRAERQGLGLAYVDPSYTSQLCSQCGLLGVRRGHQFHCLCGFTSHADVNASQNIRLRFTVLRSRGGPSTPPEALASAEGKPPTLVGGR